MCKPALSFVLLILANQAFANQTDAITCHQFTSSDLERLACYDKATDFNKAANPLGEVAAEDAQTDPVTTEPEFDSKWTVRSDVSEIDDTTNVFLSLSSDEPIRGRFGSAGPAIMNIHCRENTTMFYITFNDLHMSDYQYGTVTYRLDSGKARKKKMGESTDNRALGLWRGGSSIPFVKAMLGHKKMLVRATPYGENAVTAIFSIEGIDAEIMSLRKSCQW